MAEDALGFNFLRDQFQRIIADESAARAASHLVMNEVAFDVAGDARAMNIGKAKDAVSQAIENKYGEFRPNEPDSFDFSEGEDFFLL